jgi:hypothetical protein
MALDDKVTEAIYAVTQKNYQPEKLAKRLIKCLTDLAEANTSLDKEDDIEPYLESVLDGVMLHTFQDENSFLL